MVAAQLLADGYDSPALRESAGLPADDVAEVREVFVRALCQLGVHVDGYEEAQTRQLRPWVEEALAGQLTRADLSERVSRIWRIRDLVGNDGLPPAVSALILACLGDDWRVDDGEFARALVDARRALE